MDYRYLKAFLNTADLESFSLAAKKLNIAQSAVSRQIKLLEESIGQELIVRSSKKIILTEKGTELYTLIKNFDHTANSILNRESLRPLKIGILQGLLKHWFEPILIKYFKKTKSNIIIKISDCETLVNGVENGDFDIIFSTTNAQTDLISSLKIFDEKLVLISKEEINKKKLSTYPWIVYGNEDKMFQISKKKSSSIISVEDLSTIVNCVRSNIGIAIVPDHCLKKNENLFIYPAPGVERTEIFMTTLNFQTMPPHILELKKIIEKS